MKTFLFLLLALLSSDHCLQAQSKASSYKIVRRINIEGDYFWDYCTVDESTERLFVSHGMKVQVIDLKSGTMAGVIPDTRGVHGIALAPDLNKGFTSNGRDSDITVFNYQTLAPIATVNVTGVNPDAIYMTHLPIGFSLSMPGVTTLR